MTDSANTHYSTDRRSRTYQLRAIVLRRMNLGESDRILTVFSRELGKHRFVAKGVRRPGSKLAGHSEPFMMTRLLVARTRGLPILTQAECITPYARFRQDERAIAVAGVMAERVESLLPEDEAAPRVFALIENCLELLDSATDPAKVQLIFDLLILSETGFRPGFQTCVECGNPLEAMPNRFVMDRGGFICTNCSVGATRSVVVPVDVQKVMRMIDRGAIGQVVAVKVQPETVRQALDIVSECISTITGRESTALKVIRELRLEYDHRDGGSEPEDPDGIRI